MLQQILLNVWECVKTICFISAWCGEPTLLQPLHWLADSCSDTDHCHCRKLNSNSNKIILGTAVESLHIYKQYQLCAISFNTVQFHAMSNDSSTPYDEVLFAETIFSRATIHCFASLSSITQYKASNTCNKETTHRVRTKRKPKRKCWFSVSKFALKMVGNRWFVCCYCKYLCWC